jgi:hypothetical protein
MSGRLRKNAMSYRSVIPGLMSALFLCCVLWPSGTSLASPQRSRPVSQARTQTRASGAASKNADACSLLTGPDIAALLGEPLDAIKPSVQSAGSLKMSHCLFVTRDFAKSASLDVATPGSSDSSGRKLRAFWRDQFHSPREQEGRPASSRKFPAHSAFSATRAIPTMETETTARQGESESEAEAEAGKPRRIPGVGEEAYWVGTPQVGALYVLQGNLFLRISVGGISEESARIAESKSIAKVVLSRLRR